MFPSFARVLLAAARVLVCLALMAGAAAAQGSGSSTPAPKTLKELIESATKHYQAGDFDSAASEYFAAYEKKPLPALLFNVAQSHRKAGRHQEALALYERFLKDDPKSTLAPEAEAHATAMRAQIDAAKASAEREAAERLARQRAEEAEALARLREAERKKVEASLLLASRKDVPKTPVYKKAWFWVLIGGAVVAAAVVPAVVVTTLPKDPPSDLGVRVVQF